MSKHLLYIELRDEDAAEVLRPLLSMLARQPNFEGGELLTSPAQPGLALVQARFEGEPPEVPLTPGAKSWSFLVLETVVPDKD